MQVQLCMMRGFQRIRGDIKFPAVTVFGNLMISLILGSVFYDLPDTAETVNRRCIVLFFAILFNALSSALEVRRVLTVLGHAKSLPSRKLTWLDPRPLCPTTHCRETCTVRALSSLL
jgi:hypothetical protein